MRLGWDLWNPVNQLSLDWSARMTHLLENFSEVLRVCEKEVLVLVAPQYLIRLKYVLYVSRCDACGLRNFLDADFFLLILKKQA